MKRITSSSLGSRRSHTTAVVALRVTLVMATPWLTLLSCVEQRSVFAASTTTTTTGEERSSGEASVPRFNGSWKPCEDRVERDLERFDAAIEAIPWYKMIVRRRLKEFRLPPERPEVFSLEVDSESISMAVDSKDGSFHWDVAAPISGAKTQARDWHGEEMTASFKIRRGRMTQHFDKPGRGSRTNISTLNERGDRLKLKVKIESDHLDGPFVYVLHYCRA